MLYHEYEVSTSKDVLHSIRECDKVETFMVIGCFSKRNLCRVEYQYRRYKMKLRLLTLILLGALLTGCAQDNGTSSEIATTEEISKAASEVERTEVQAETAAETQAQEEEPYIVTFEANTIEGEVVTSEMFSQSRLTMINVWATYCNPCLSEMPDLGEIATEYDSAEFQMIGVISDVAEDAIEEDINNAKDLIQQTSANYPHLLLNESLYRNLVGGVSSVPTTFFVDQKGEMLGYAIGAQSKDTWVSIIEDLLSKCD